MRRLIVTILFALGLSLAQAGAPAWEAVEGAMRMPAAVAADQRAGAEKVEVAVRDEFIYVVTPRQTSVKVFTILGQMVSSVQLQPGTHRLRLSAKGIYIVKAGTTTHRVII